MKKIMFNDKYGLTQAVLEGRKTMTRRICKYDRPDESWDIVFPVFESKDYDSEGNLISPLYGAFGWKNKDGDFTGWNNPLYKVGEVVAIAQSYKDIGYNGEYSWVQDEIHYHRDRAAGWDNKMFVKADLMPHHIEITYIKIERLQDISDEDCLKEGIIHASTFLGQKIYHTPHVNGSYLSANVPQEAFACLIDKVSGKGAWESNPFVFAYEFVLFD